MALQTKTWEAGDYAYRSWSNGYKIHLTLTEESTSVENNASVISYRFWISNTNNNRFIDNGWSWSISIGGQTIPIDNFDFYVYPYNAEQTIASGSITVEHNNDGYFDMPFSVSIPNVKAYNQYAPPAMSLSGTWALTFIPRGSTIGATPTNIGETSVIAVHQSNSSYTHSIAYQFGDISGFVTASGGTTPSEVKFKNTSIPFAIPESFYSQIPNSPSGSCILTCRTYSGATQIGEAISCSFTVKADPAKCSPIVYGAVEDANAATLAVTGDKSVFVRFQSNALCTITATPQHGAGIDQKAIDGKVLDIGANISTIPNVESDKVSFVVVDTRGYPGSFLKRLTVIPYIKLTVNASIKRTDPVSGDAILTLEGNCFNGSFGKVDNTLTVQYQIDSETPVSQPLQIFDDNSYKATLTVSGLAYTQAHQVIVTVSDALDSSTATLSVKKGIPVFDWGENDFRFNVPVYLSNGLMAKSFVESSFRGDANTLFETGFYRTDFGSTNCPSDDGFLLVFSPIDGFAIQIGCANSGEDLQYRTCWDGTWCEWKALA